MLFHLRQSLSLYRRYVNRAGARILPGILQGDRDARRLLRFLVHLDMDLKHTILHPSMDSALVLPGPHQG